MEANYAKLGQEILHGEMIVILMWYGEADLNLFAATGDNNDKKFYCAPYNTKKKTYDKNGKGHKVSITTSSDMK